MPRNEAGYPVSHGRIRGKHTRMTRTGTHPPGLPADGDGVGVGDGDGGGGDDGAGDGDRDGRVGGVAVRAGSGPAGDTLEGDGRAATGCA